MQFASGLPSKQPKNFSLTIFDAKKYHGHVFSLYIFQMLVAVAPKPLPRAECPSPRGEAQLKCLFTNDAETSESISKNRKIC